VGVPVGCIAFLLAALLANVPVPAATRSGQVASVVCVCGVCVLGGTGAEILAASAGAVRHLRSRCAGSNRSREGEGSTDATAAGVAAAPVAAASVAGVDIGSAAEDAPGRYSQNVSSH